MVKVQVSTGPHIDRRGPERGNRSHDSRATEQVRRTRESISPTQNNGPTIGGAQRQVHRTDAGAMGDLSVDREGGAGRRREFANSINGQGNPAIRRQDRVHGRLQRATPQDDLVQRSNRWHGTQGGVSINRQDPTIDVHAACKGVIAGQGQRPKSVLGQATPQRGRIRQKTLGNRDVIGVRFKTCPARLNEGTRQAR